MGRIPRKLEWGGVFLAMAYTGILLGSSVDAFAESTPSKSENSPVSKLASEQAIAFQSGYVQDFPEPTSGMVIGAREAKRLYGQGDSLYLRLAPTTDAKVGDRFTLFRPTTHMYHPITRDYMGRMVVILGILEIAKLPGDDVTEARIVRSFEAMAPGDLLKPYEAPPPVPAQQVTSGPLTGIVLDFKTPRQLTGQSETVYLDKGEMDGLALGDRFSVSHRGQRLSATSKNPDQAIAELKVISMQARTATATVLHSSDAIRRGDAISRLPPPPPKAEPPAAPPKEAAAGAVAAAKAAPAPAKPAAPAVKALEDVYFDSGKSKLTDQAKKTLAEHADYLKQNPTLAITIEGHSDVRGSAQSGLTIGEKRAQEVRKFLTGLGVKNTLTVTSFGKDRPVCTEKTAACHAKNRRVHLAAGN
jgi:outer membrane protein OmpA-like peptidoglycan-associated protein